MSKDRAETESQTNIYQQPFIPGIFRCPQCGRIDAEAMSALETAQAVRYCPSDQTQMNRVSWKDICRQSVSACHMDWLQKNADEITIARDFRRGTSVVLEYCWPKTGCQVREVGKSIDELVAAAIVSEHLLDCGAQTKKAG